MEAENIIGAPMKNTRAILHQNARVTCLPTSWETTFRINEKFLPKLWDFGAFFARKILKQLIVIFSHACMNGTLTLYKTNKRLANVLFGSPYVFIVSLKNYNSVIITWFENHYVILLPLPLTWTRFCNFYTRGKWCSTHLT